MAGTAPAWQYLGMISNQKPSAIFKISKLKIKPAHPNVGMSFGGGRLQQTIINAQVGISIESLVTLENMASSAAAAATESSPASRCYKIEGDQTNLLEGCINHNVSGQTKVANYL